MKKLKPKKSKSLAPRIKSAPVDDPKQIRLEQLCEDITGLNAEMEDMVVVAQKHGLKALEMALKLGRLLLEAKSLVKHGEWENWCKKHVKGCSVSTIQNYMRIAKNPNLGFLKTSKNLYEAYIQVGIFPPEPKRLKEPYSTETIPVIDVSAEPVNTIHVEQSHETSPESAAETVPVREAAATKTASLPAMPSGASEAVEGGAPTQKGAVGGVEKGRWKEAVEKMLDKLKQEFYSRIDAGGKAPTWKEALETARRRVLEMD